MTFEIITPKTTGGIAPAIGPADLVVSTHRAPRGRGRWLKLRIGRQLAEAAALRPGGDTTLHWGAGADQGKLKLAPPRPGEPTWPVREGGRGKTRGRYLTITTSALPEGFPCRGKPHKAHHEVLAANGQAGGPQLVITLPRQVWHRRAGAADGPLEDAAA